MIFDAKHEMIRKLVRQFAETELTTEVLDKVEETGEFPEEIVDKMAKCGFLGLKIPREYGGAGADTLAYVIMIEEIARVSAVASLYANTPNSLGGGPLMQAGTPEQLEKYLRPSVENKVKIVFGLTEPGAGSDASSMVTTAVKDGADYILNGRKCFISGAPLADYCIVSAQTDLPLASASACTRPRWACWATPPPTWCGMMSVSTREICWARRTWALSTP